VAALSLEFYDHQSAHPVELERIRAWVARALPLVFAAPGPEESSLTGILEVEFSFVDDTTITQVHADFLDDATPTDVITFHHGEILISTETAARQAPEHGLDFTAELALYAIHGLLHLHGHEDHSEAGAARMKALQNGILAQVCAER
jgi:probable rRNA maturation factor